MTLHIERKIVAPKEVLWRYLSDYSNIYKFHPLLKNSHFVEGSCAAGLGATRQCDMLDGSFLKEKVTEWQEGSHYTIDVYETSLPVRKAKATLGLRTSSYKETIAYMDMEIESKYAFLTPFMTFFFRYIGGPAVLRGLDKIYQAEVQEWAKAEVAPNA